MSASDRSGAGKTLKDRAYSDILFSLASFSDELYPVSYGKVGLHFKRAVEELEKEIRSSKEAQQAISISPHAFEVRGNGIFNLLRLSKNEIIGPVIAVYPQLDVALDGWSDLNCVNDLERDRFLRDLLSEKYKTPPNPVAVKIGNILFKELSRLAPGAPFRFIGESLAAFKRIDKECKKLALKSKSINTKVGSTTYTSQVPRLGLRDRIFNFFFSKTQGAQLQKKVTAEKKALAGSDPETNEFKKKNV